MENEYFKIEGKRAEVLLVFDELQIGLLSVRRFHSTAYMSIRRNVLGLILDLDVSCRLYKRT